MDFRNTFVCMPNGHAMLERNPIFADRADAGRRLAERLKARSYEAPIVLALPRGGVPVGFEIAKALTAPLDVLLVRKIGAPGQEEFALGAVVEGEEPIVVVNEGPAGEYGGYIEREAARQAEEITRRRTLYRGGLPLVRVADRTVIVVDDGVATGATFRAALEAVRRMKAAKIVAAIPVAPADSLALIEAKADAVECLATPENFHAVGLHYGVFDQTSDAEVVRLLAPFR